MMFIINTKSATIVNFCSQIKHNYVNFYNPLKVLDRGSENFSQVGQNLHYLS